MEEKNKVDMLNVLRFIAFIMIFLLHSKIFMPVTWNDNFQCAWLFYTPAWAGTWIFFILSGYGIGCGFYSGKYELSVKGIISYCTKRISAIVPIYYFYIFAIAIFVKPEILIPTREHVQYMLKLLFFHYHAEFYGAEYGLAWYMSTLIRLYFIAPLGYFCLKRILKSQKQVYIIMFAILLIGLSARCLMHYYITSTGNGNWSDNVYTPFYFNFDLFFSGMLLSHIKHSFGGGGKTAKPISFLALLIMITVNSYIYYASVYEGANFLNLYMYVFPSIYIIIIGFYIYNFDINRSYKQTPLTIRELKKNPIRIFDFYKKIQFSTYLFHSTVLLQLANAFDIDFYENICNILKIPNDKHNCAIGLLYTLMSLTISIFWSIIIYRFNTSKKGVNTLCANQKNTSLK